MYVCAKNTRPVACKIQIKKAIAIDNYKLSKGTTYNCTRFCQNCFFKVLLCLIFVKNKYKLRHIYYFLTLFNHSRFTYRLVKKMLFVIKVCMQKDFHYVRGIFVAQRLFGQILFIFAFACCVDDALCVCVRLLVTVPCFCFCYTLAFSYNTYIHTHEFFISAFLCTFFFICYTIYTFNP